MYITVGHTSLPRATLFHHSHSVCCCNKHAQPLRSSAAYLPPAPPCLYPRTAMTPWLELYVALERTHAEENKYIVEVGGCWAGYPGIKRACTCMRCVPHGCCHLRTSVGYHAWRGGHAADQGAPAAPACRRSLWTAPPLLRRHCSRRRRASRRPRSSRCASPTCCHVRGCAKPVLVAGSGGCIHAYWPAPS